MTRNCWILCLLLIVAYAFDAKAWPRKPPPPRPAVNTPAERRMDKNRDGWVQPKEAARAKRHGYFRPSAVVDRPWERAADRDNDGFVDGPELRAYHLAHLDANGDGRIGRAERIAYWHRRWRVNTAVEKKYDRDGDGYLEWTEAVEMLKAKHALVATGGQAKVDTDLELEFDVNGDGVLDRSEAPALAAALAAVD